MRASLVAPALAAVALLCPTMALAQAPAKPQPRCGLKISDGTGDATSQVPTQVRPRPPALDITRVFLEHEPGRSAGATTVNIEVVNLTTDIPLGTTGLNWTALWLSPTGRVRFVRAVLDYTGSVIYEFGEVVPGFDVPPVGNNILPRHEPRGQTTGALFTGAQGIIQIAIPDTWDGAPGTQLNDLYAQGSEARQIMPNAVNAPSRGLSFQADRAPNDPATAKWKIADSACPPPAPAA